MLNDIVKTYGGTSGIWESAATPVRKTSDGSFTESLNRAARTDTVEFSNTVPHQNALSHITAEKNSVLSELSGIHTDVNKFLEIKEQVRTGTYELNAVEIAKGITEYSVF